ncbi:MAG: hypothetical protein HY744_10215 [Deltaproteobacteria bacterium]|nr:hypothetical protein [Deltaproteobacteria bacterium]
MARFFTAGCSDLADDCCGGLSAADAGTGGTGGGAGGGGSGGSCASCKGACERCEAGACVPRATGHAGEPSCAPYLCDGKDTACPQSCTGDGSCVPGHFCAADKSCQAKGELGASCVAPGECASGLCVDGYCCNDACEGTCISCNVPGKEGTCTEVPKAEPDPGTCEGPGKACDGAAYCKLVLGQGCNTKDECLSGFCVDGVCCNNTCDGTCQACNLDSKGTCGPVPKGNEDPSASSPCKLTKACDGAGKCLLKDGQSCSVGSQCLSGNCSGNPAKCQS